MKPHSAILRLPVINLHNVQDIRRDDLPAVVKSFKNSISTLINILKSPDPHLPMQFDSKVPANLPLFISPDLAGLQQTLN
jgi:hypothetical protein